MKKALYILLLLSLQCQAQLDTIKTDAYTAILSESLKAPIMVTYKLYHGGGECSRAKFHFHNDTKFPTATPADYSHSGYDEGHLANAEDFAFDCKLEEQTFRFYNCQPQTHNMNAGLWKTWETLVRMESQTDILLIVCGGIFSDTSRHIGNGVTVPDACWKVVKSLSTGKVLHVILVSNKTADNTLTEYDSIEKLEAVLGYKITYN